MYRRALIIITSIVVCSAVAHAQPAGVLHLDDPVHEFLVRQQTLGLLPSAHVSHAPLSGHEAYAYLDSLPDGELTPRDRRLLARYRREAEGPHWLSDYVGFAYRNGYDLYAAEGENYTVQINPYIHAGAGPVTGRGERTSAVWHYARGARVSGTLSGFIFFEGRLTDNVTKPVWPTFVDLTADRLGFTSFENGSYGYFTSVGHVGVHLPNVELRLSRDHNNWGPGATSLILSDYASVYDHVQLRATLGRAQYVVVLAGLSEPRLQPEPRDVIEPRKYAAFHRLALKITDRIELGLFESVVFATDSLGARTGFDWSYVNPLVFYRAVERDRGSADNMLLGGSLSWIARPGMRLYGELVLDELIVSDIGSGTWSNKWGWTLGGHFVPLPDLSVRAEYSRLRPYLYSHVSARSDYLHHRDLLGHPAGPNAEDFALFVDYSATERIHVALNAALTRHGRNDAGLNYGGDPLLPYTSRASDTDVRLLQGIRENLLLFELYGGYEILPKLHLEAALIGQSVDDAALGSKWYLSPQLQIRWGMPFQSLRY